MPGLVTDYSRQAEFLSTREDESHCVGMSLVPADMLLDVHSVPIHERNQDVDHSQYTAEGLAEAVRANQDWYGLDGNGTYQEIVDAIKFGWPLGGFTMKRFSQNLRDFVDATPICVKRTVRYGDTGHELCASRLLDGKYDSAWISRVSALSRGPGPITLVVNWGGLGSRSSTQLAWNTGYGIVVADMLEEAGFSVEMFMMNMSEQNHYSPGQRHGQEYSAVLTPLKEAWSPVNYTAMAGLGCHSGVFRTHGFRAKLSCPVFINSGMGSTRDLSEWSEMLQPGLDSFGLHEVIYLKQAYNEQDARKAVEETITAINEKYE